MKAVDSLAIPCVFPSREPFDLRKECVSGTGKEKMEKASVHSLQKSQRNWVCLEPWLSIEFYQGSGVIQGYLLEKDLPIHIFAISYLFQGEQLSHNRKNAGLVIRSLGFDSAQTFYKVMH